MMFITKFGAWSRHGHGHGEHDEPGHGRGSRRGETFWAQFGPGGAFGPGGPFDLGGAAQFGGPRGFGRRAGRTRRGAGKYLILHALAQKPQHGYELMNAIEATRGFRPSAGSIYPQLQMLEDGGFVTSNDQDGKRIYTITDAGRELLAEHAPVSIDDVEDDELEIAPDHDGPRGRSELRGRIRGSVHKLMAALMSAHESDAATLEKIRTIVDRARREIHATLAADDDDA